MRHFHSFEEVEFLSQPTAAPGPATWVAIGAFDGVHRGHQSILRPMAEQAHAAGALAAVVTFFPHPVVVLRGLTDPIYLTSPEERAELLGELGIDLVITLPFTRELAGWSAEYFMQQLSDHLHIRQLWAGSDFALGRNRQGDLPTLRAIGERLGYTVTVPPDVLVDGERISSSRIRRLVRDGQVAEAARLLGRPYRLEGPVIHGDERGRTLGFPTANVGFWNEKIVPAFGVYSTWVWIPGPNGPERKAAVTSVGLRPTFNPPILTPRVEPYLIDFEGNLYDQTVCVEFIEFQRPELRFDSAEALINQMILDTQHAREVLAHAA